MTTDDVTIRVATDADLAALIELGRRTFEDTYGHANDPAELASHMAEVYNAQALGETIRDPQAALLVAEMHGKAVGFATLVVDSHETGIDATHPAEVNKLYVATDQHGRGLGRSLLSACIEHARAEHCDVVWLGVWEGNPEAIRFYERFGFRTVGRHDYQLGSQRQTDYLMVLRIGAEAAG